MKQETKELITNIKSGKFTKQELIDIIIMLITKMELLDNKVDNLDTVCGYMIKDLDLNKYSMI
jgi:hypothetical protein